MKLHSFKNHLEKELTNPEFRKAYEEEKRLLELGIQIIDARKEQGLTQKELAAKSRVTQQQLSKIENGANCNMLTFIRVSSTLGLKINL